jgi:hypothetical protein
MPHLRRRRRIDLQHLLIIKHILLVLLPVVASVCVAQSPWPGQSGNSVGYAAYGSLSSTPCGSFSSGSSWSSATTVRNCAYSTAQTINCDYCIFDSVDFNAGTGATTVSGSNILFIGDRFQSNDSGFYNVFVSGASIYFFYDSVTPLASLYTSPPGAAWPSAGAGTNTYIQTTGTNCINGNDGYEYGIFINTGAGPVVIDHTDIWGMGVAVDWLSTAVGTSIVTNSWVHDPPNASPQGYHLDGLGYLNGAAGPNNIELIGNTIGFIGNTDAVAFQGATSGYDNIQVVSNYLSGEEYTVHFTDSTTQATNSSFYGNVIGTDIAEIYGPLYGAIWNPGTGSVWACNTISFLTGTTWTANGNWAPTSGMNGQYWVPSTTPNSATDNGGNTICGGLAPSSLAWKSQEEGTSSTQTVTFRNNNSATISISSIAPAVGTYFTVSSTTCGSTLASGASCTITVKFAPTVVGPLQDMIEVTDNSLSASSPQLIPLLGIGRPR